MNNKIKVKFDELKAALQEIEARSIDDRVVVEITDRKLLISAEDRAKNTITAKIYDEGNMGAEFVETKRLMFMTDKKRI